jgi:hypothetical protein
MFREHGPADETADRSARTPTTPRVRAVRLDAGVARTMHPPANQEALERMRPSSPSGSLGTMARARLLLALAATVAIAGLGAFGCRALIGASPYEDATADAASDAGAVDGQLPSLPLPPRMLVGVLDPDGTWMTASHVAWDVRWDYFSGGANGAGWYNAYSGGALSSEFALEWMRGTANQGYIPAIQYFVLRTDHPPPADAGDVHPTLPTLQSPEQMKDYFSKFKILMEAAKEVPSPVIVILEAGTFGYLELQTGDDPTAHAAIAESGLEELADLPNTVAGFGLAFLKMRTVVGATNVVMGPDVVPSVAGDVLGSLVSDNLEPHVDTQTKFFRALGVGQNPFGAPFDFVAAHPALSDADYVRLVEGDSTGTWDPSDDASVYSRSFNRCAQWLKLFHDATKTPWLLWQLPMGNSNSPNVPNKDGAWAGPYPAGTILPPGCRSGSTTGCPGGYKDNRPEYFFGLGHEPHLALFADAGVFGLLFGANGSDQSTQVDDYYSDGNLFLASRVAAFLDAGGFPLGRSK